MANLQVADQVAAAWDRIVVGNPLWTWALAVGIALGVFLALLIARRIVASRARTIAQRRPRPATQLAARLAGSVNRTALLVFSSAGGSLHLALSAKAGQGVRIAVAVAAGVQAIVWGRHLIDVMLERLLAAKTTDQGQPDPALLTALTPIRFLSMAVLLGVVVLIVLDNAGVDVTAMVAGLGIGGIAIALAAQSILGDLFAAVSIVVDKPFMVGDFITVDDKLGTVESIGLKTTRLRALSGEQLVFANSDLLKSRIQNFRRMHERRVLFTVGVVYQTPAEKLRQIPRIVREAIEHNSPTRFDRCHFKRFADSALEFEAVYYVGNPEFNVFMNIQQAVNLELFERLQREGVEFAYPTRTLFVNQSPGG
ncbi:MAG: mechanosensitive ion channel family protein [Phycisphaerae bacterium]|nr:mechanosensitive ion channel family protein [Phycisphaerae bacterium]